MTGLDWPLSNECSILLLVPALFIVLALLFRKVRPARVETITITARDSPNIVVCGIEVTPKTVSRKARSYWPGGEAVEVLEKLGKGSESLRTKLAALWLSNGSLAELKRWVDIGKVEEQDVIAFAEHPPEIWSDRTSGTDLDMGLGARRAEHTQRYRAWLTDED